MTDNTYKLGASLLKTWSPIVIGVFTLAGFWFALNSRVQALEDRQAPLAETAELLLERINQMTLDIAIMRNDIQYIKEAIKNER